MKRRYVLLSTRLLSVCVVAAIIWRDYAHGGHIAWMQDVATIGVVSLLNVAMAQGRRLSQRNMRKYGLDPDRD